MIAYIRQNPNIALGIHHHLTEAPHLQQLNTPIKASTPQTPKRNLDATDSNDAHISKQQRVLSNRKQKEGHVITTFISRRKITKHGCYAKKNMSTFFFVCGWEKTHD
ncbi:unnamed protein product [Rotaria magnacalcarata]|uniref:Uncharacterized protein n=1 Tax=Rotaria magnacalcarata TaxID=392030 RepID=A0A819NK85_9BILA|nr:unnamed protein product [Rotaria magnacalcarata]CAF4003556.1 unnamed protein product [Rotaria magnacalcarata]CAF4111989.1 unnamed protein product [Rotaria magnacalcarata]